MADGSVLPNQPDSGAPWVFRYSMVASIDGTTRYWYVQPRSSMVTSPINVQDLPKEVQLVRWLLGDE